MVFPPIYHHTGLETSGGATRVAQLVVDGLRRRNVETNHSFELAEKQDGTAILPNDFGRYLPGNAIGHLHSTGNWPDLLTSISARARVVITMHDCELFTGGCPYPLDCADLDEKCADPCSRNFPEAESLKKQKLHQVQRLEPALVAPSRWMARLAKTHLYRSVTVVPNGIPWPEQPVSKRVARRKLGLHNAARVAVFAAHGGMNAAYKSGDAWKDIWTALKARMPRLVCFAVGGDREEQQGDLILWPYVDRARLSLLMNAADVLLYPTRADNHSLVVLEAMSCSLPVVAYSVGGIPEQVTDQYTGLLVPSGRNKVFIDAAELLLSDPAMIRQMGVDAFDSGRKRFDSERMVEGYMSVYKSLIGE
ncbi:glycosyltransferase [Pseudodesulfovibrio sediminis]|uniref:Glycosyl transferase n=1 Tax=Pseudodesulfovibrio sediminis TaxID=2810563 RepID=A0ABN6EUI8_9BACT|nr:glycosyltransferase [Pseudodesulfovibrio sediminis]BCS88874.1 glycosyl transferase [Pseudodesulfovibrio sediminis]